MKKNVMFEKDLISYTLCGRRRIFIKACEAECEELATRPSVMSTSSHTDFGLLSPKQGRLEGLIATELSCRFRQK